MRDKAFTFRRAGWRVVVYVAMPPVGGTPYEIATTEAEKAFAWVLNEETH